MRATVKYLIPIAIVIVGMLLYVMLQVNAYRISYEIRQNESKLSKVSEENKKLRFDIARLKNPERIEEILTRKDISLEMPHDINQVTFVLPKKVLLHGIEMNQKPSFFNLFGLVKEAQAKVAEDM